MHGTKEIVLNTVAEPRKKKGVALAGVAAGTTAICTVGHSGNDLHYRGYDILELAEHATFEEVAHLLIHGELPTPAELEAYCDKLMRLRSLPPALLAVLEQIPASAHPMDVLRTGCSMLGTLEPEAADRNLGATRDLGDRLIACFSTGTTTAATAAASRSRPPTARSPRISCTCCTASRRRPCTSAP